MDCLAHGVPVPEISWYLFSGLSKKLIDRKVVVNQDPKYTTEVTPLFHVLSHNKSLYFRPFSPSEFRQDIHDTLYQCRATSESGIALSRRVRVKAGKTYY